MKRDWIKNNTFHYGEFSDLNRLVAVKDQKALKISLCLPTLNEEKTIAKEIVIFKSELMMRYPLIDEIVVIDSDSSDKTREIASDFGATVFKASKILPQLDPYKGKGENLWKALYVASGDIIVYLDADIKNIHHRFAYGLLGPLLLNEGIKYSKAFYDRPIATEDNKVRPTGGGRVTELVIRPLFSLFFPELTQIVQPLSGEYAGYRDIFEQIPFPIGYGIETSMILDIYHRWGLDVIAQVDLEKRVHRNQETKALGKMAFAIIKTFMNRQCALGRITLQKEMFDEMIQYSVTSQGIEPDILEIKGYERPAIIEIPAYRKKFRSSTPDSH